MKYHFKITKEKVGYSAQGIELEGCFSQGDTLDELKANLQEALSCFVEEPESSYDIAALPDEEIKPSKTILEIELDPKVAFAFLVRRARIKHGLTQKQVAHMLGFERVWSYQRLESSQANPSLETIMKIKKVFPDLPLDTVFA